ncbi:MAG: fibrobacter succinogenes major paralogous domain-containing protein, partial [Bacteroidetes bacterium]|nr:fibrobacter succinogenes major paralogous domain-containing protein [Bacteroidota bacterium]
LYNWYAVNDSRGLAPQGWHVASGDDWNTLADFLGGWQGAGGKLKDAGTLHWSMPNTGGMNTVLFTATPAGMRNADGSYTGVNATAYWWTSTLDYPKVIEYDDPGLWNGNSGTEKQCGLPVRCVKDN